MNKNRPESMDEASVVLNGLGGVGFYIGPQNPLEEDEADADLVRRHQEIDNQVNALGDDLFDGEFEASIINSTINNSCESHNCKSRNCDSPVLRHLSESSAGSPDKRQDCKLAMSSDQFKHLEAMYDVRLRQIEKLQQEHKAAEEELEGRCNVLQRKNIMLQAEKASTEVSLKQCQALLAEEKVALEKVTQQNELLSKENQALKEKNAGLEKEVSTWMATAADYQNQLRLLKKNISENTDEKQLAQRHAAQLEKLEKACQEYCQQLEAKTTECLRLDQRLKDANNARDSALLDKSKAVTSLMKDLEESQARYFQLMDGTSLLRHEKGMLETELMQVKANATSERLVGDASSLEEKHQQSSGSDGSVKLLTHELQRSLAEQEGKRKEIRSLECQLRSLRDKKHALMASTAQQKVAYDKLLAQFEEQSLELQRAVESTEELRKHNADLSLEVEDLRATRQRPGQAEQEQEKEELTRLAAESKQLAEELEHSRELVRDLEDKLSKDAERSELIESLKLKAKQFEEFIEKNQKMTKDAEVQISSEPTADSQTQMFVMETQMRQQLMQEYAGKLRLVKDKLECELALKARDLENVQTENELLHAQMDEDRKALMNLASRWVTNLQSSMQKINEKESQLGSLRGQVKSLRASEEAKATEIKKLMSRVVHLEKSLQGAQELAEHHKVRVGQCENHYKAEFKRIKEGYEGALLKIRNRSCTILAKEYFPQETND